MSNRSFACSVYLGKLLVTHDIAHLQQRATPDPDTARATLRLARLVEQADGEPSEAASWLIRYLDDRAGAGGR